jgi:hypothetical protein
MEKKILLMEIEIILEIPFLHLKIPLGRQIPSF